MYLSLKYENMLHKITCHIQLINATKKTSTSSEYKPMLFKCSHQFKLEMLSLINLKSLNTVNHLSDEKKILAHVIVCITVSSK